MEKEIELSLPWGTELKIESGEQVDAWRYVWIALLRVHANIDGTDEVLLFRCIKDAYDNMQGAKTMKFPDCLALYVQDDGEEHYTDGHDEEEHNTDGHGVPDGTKLSRLIDRLRNGRTFPPRRRFTVRGEQLIVGLMELQSVGLVTITCMIVMIVNMKEAEDDRTV
jgi:hypothetical protein